VARKTYSTSFDFRNTNNIIAVAHAIALDV
jgi:hypothetical protein